MDRYNAEGYPDPTAAEALENIMREEKAKNYKPCVFICSPFAGDIEKNLNKAREYLKFAVKQGTIPFAPHLLYPQAVSYTHLDVYKRQSIYRECFKHGLANR